MLRILNIVCVIAVVALVPASSGWAAVTPYSQDFEALNQADPGSLAGDGWKFWVNVAAPVPYGYGGDAPNGPQICAIATGEGGPDQGSQQLSVYSDYNNTDHGNGYIVETNVYQERPIDAVDVGTTVIFRFDAKLGNLEGSSEAEGFIKTIDPSAGYATTNHFTVDLTSISTTWGGFSLQLTLDAGLVGQLLQFGFTTRASNYEGSGIVCDNVDVEAVLPSLTLAKSSTLIDDQDASNTLSAGDTLQYTVTATNNAGADVLGAVLDDTPDPNTTLSVGTVVTSQGTILSGSTAGDTAVSVDLGTLPVGVTATVTFEVTLNDPVPDGVSEITNQATLSGGNLEPMTSNTTVDAVGERLQRMPIPTLSTWGRAMLIVLLAAGALWRLRS